MKNFDASILETALLEGLHADTKDVLKQWESNPYYESSEMVDKFWGYIKQAPAVGIVGDYDCDGICASYIMGKAVAAVCPGKKMIVRTPHRFTEGYGINEKIRGEIKEKLPAGSVIITVDNGIAAANVLETLEADGYKVLLTDHHELREGCRIPNVTMKMDPAVEETSEGFTFKKWCGAAVAYKLCEQVVPEALAKELKVFAGVATVADCMDLKGGNWGLVRNAISEFRKGTAPRSLAAMLTAMKQDPLYINEDAFGFYLGPCFNAPGRLLDEGAGLVLKYLFSPTTDKLDQLVELNERRKSLRDEEYELVKAKISELHLEDKCPIWVNVPNLHEGIVGILAGKVAEEYKVPAIVTTTSDTPGLLKGSARSSGDINIFKFLSSFAELFDRMGGHAGAAGLSITEENFEKAAEHQMERPSVEATDECSYKINAEDIPFTEKLLSNFRPFGEGNPAPLFSLDVDISGQDVMIGREKNHLCIKGEDFKITHFFHDPNELRNKEHFGMTGHIAMSAFNGVETPTFNAEEIYDCTDEVIL